MGNTGYKSFASLELYYTDDNSYAGTTKPNVNTDPDYIAPVLDTATCIPSARYYNTVRTLNATKNDCASGYFGSEVTLTANANQFVSTINVADANAQADAWLAENVQAYANRVGTCSVQPSIVINSISGSNLYFTLSSGYSPNSLHVDSSTYSSTGPWTTSTGGVVSPRVITEPTVTTWYRMRDTSNADIVSNVYLKSINTLTTPGTPAKISQTGTSVYFGWSSDFDPNATNYEIFRKTGINGTYSLIATVNVSVTTYNDTTLTTGFYYVYKIRAKDNAGNFSNFSNEMEVNT